MKSQQLSKDKWLHSEATQREAIKFPNGVSGGHTRKGLIKDEIKVLVSQLEGWRWHLLRWRNCKGSKF